ncbi:hypothetical protein LQ948_02595 [Jiella sp. MQZ9-1]|uniref:Uncharacterized protein n=1 Tax=Jiella flava TaxID=2816857 RepID=A0A939FY02_9HYPH|nr:hypothetical protein [Jiella flava]MBO0661454.1 hypothetical protein [Jiella flava]MCD2470097.1 hypothetical protein [Jiella flava]
MQTVLRTALLAATALSIGLGSAFAQSSDTAKGTDADQPNLVLPPNAAPKPMSPAETETPTKPAASGGEASDATESGAPLGSAPAKAQSSSGDEKAAKPGRNPSAASDNPVGADGQPRNAVGDKFQLPHLTAENQIRMIADLCGIQIRDMSPAACACLGKEAMTKLTPPQRDYLIASVVAPPTADQLIKKGKVHKDDQKAIFAFLNAASASCKADPKSAGSDIPGESKPAAPSAMPPAAPAKPQSGAGEGSQ